jgi:hypothetical protein
MDENKIKKVLLWLNKNGAATFDEMFDGADMSSVIEQNQIKTKLLKKELITKVGDIIEPEYKVSEIGKVFLSELSFYENLDLIRDYFYRKYHDRETKSYHTVQYVCELLESSEKTKIEYHYDYEKMLFESGILERIWVNRDTAYALKPEYCNPKHYGAPNKNYYAEAYMEEFHKSEKPQKISAKINLNTGNINIGSNAEVKQTIFLAEQSRGKKSFWDKYGDTAKIIGGIGAVTGLIAFLVKYFI